VSTGERQELVEKRYGAPLADARIKTFKATVRCIPLDDRYDGPGKCTVTGEPVDRRVVIAKAY
jgi:prolyl-tRNA synthetase